MSDHMAEMYDAATKLAEHGDRELWKPDRHEQLAACEILLASSIPPELRILVRELELKLATDRRAA